MLGNAGFTETVAAPKPKLEAIVAPAIPHSMDAEEALLGALAIDPSQMLNVSYLMPKDFYLGRNAIVYQAMAKLWERNQTYDLITLTEHLKSAGQLDNIGGVGIIADMINFTPTSYNAGHYAAIIYKNSILRQTINGATRAAQLAYDPGERNAVEVVNEVVGMFSGIDATRNVSGGPQPMRAGVDALLDRLEQIEQSGEIMGLQTGLQTVDHTLGGFGDKKFYLLAGRPGMGKSALALQIAYNIARNGIPVLYFSLEMSKEDIAARLTSLVSGVPYESFTRPSNGHLGQIIEAADRVARLPIIIDDSPSLTASDIRSRAQKIMISEDVGVVMIDHGGIVRPERTTGNKYADQSQIADSLMAMPKQLGSPILVLLQLSRQLESRADKRPMMHDLRDSGKWEENADGIMFLYRDEVYNPDTEFPNLGEINTAKNRGGKRGIATVYVAIATNRFVDLETRSVRL
jgi:replicative DNA helicase